ncbi:hypothetical protein C8Q80DRAFT_1193884 [Daedaleopsis nitida]|nr:hypothetical protein C8Q80DRAFT_1193884 [Daedaleopsis nitida]
MTVTATNGLKRTRVVLPVPRAPPEAICNQRRLLPTQRTAVCHRAWLPGFVHRCLFQRVRGDPGGRRALSMGCQSPLAWARPPPLYRPTGRCRVLCAAATANQLLATPPHRFPLPSNPLRRYTNTPPPCPLVLSLSQSVRSSLSYTPTSRPGSHMVRTFYSRFIVYKYGSKIPLVAFGIHSARLFLVTSRALLLADTTSTFRRACPLSSLFQSFCVSLPLTPRSHPSNPRCRRLSVCPSVLPIPPSPRDPHARAPLLVLLISSTCPIPRGQPPRRPPPFALRPDPCMRPYRYLLLLYCILLRADGDDACG